MSDYTDLNPGSGGDRIRTIDEGGVKTQVVYSGGTNSSGNSTTTTLNSGATFTGVFEQNKFPDVMVSCQSDVAGTLYFDFSVDGTNYSTFPSTGFVVSAGVQEFHTAVKGPRYFRVRFINGSSNQGYFRLFTYYGTFRQDNSPLNSTIAQDADSIITRSPDPFVEIKLGRFSGYSMDTKFGRNQSITTAEDIWNGGGTYKGFPTTGSPETVTITSSAGATDAGFDVVISGLDANWATQTETVRLNGSGVGVSSNTWWRVNRAYVDPGTSSNSSNAGTLTCTHTTTTGNVFFVIPIGANQTHVCAFTVPVGYQLLVKRIYIAGGRATGNATADFALRTREFGKLFRDRRLFSAGNSVAVSVTYVGGLLIQAKTDIKISCTSVSATADFSAEFAYVLIANDS